MEKTRQVQISFHIHPLEEVGISSKKWYCDSLNHAPSKSCVGGHKAEYKHRAHIQYSCKKSCNFTMCQLCVEFYRNDNALNKSDKYIFSFKFFIFWVENGIYTKKFFNFLREILETSLHAHELMKIDKYPFKWYCDNVLISKACKRGHKSEFKLRDHSVYKCIKGCNFLLCDQCGEQNR